MYMELCCDLQRVKLEKRHWFMAGHASAKVKLFKILASSRILKGLLCWSNSVTPSEHTRKKKINEQRKIKKRTERW